MGGPSKISAAFDRSGRPVVTVRDSRRPFGWRLRGTADVCLPRLPVRSAISGAGLRVERAGDVRHAGLGTAVLGESPEPVDLSRERSARLADDGLAAAEPRVSSVGGHGHAASRNWTSLLPTRDASRDRVPVKALTIRTITASRRDATAQTRLPRPRVPTRGTTP